MPPHPLYNVPNAISMSRVVLAVLFIWANWEQRFAFVIVAAITDFLDGFIARRQQIVSRWGALIDPLSDRFFVFSAICVYLFVGVIDTWHYFAFLLRDIMTAVGFLVAKAMPSLRIVDFQARWSGKIVTVMQIVVLLVVPASFFPMFVTTSLDFGIGTGDANNPPFGAGTGFVDLMFILVGLASLWSVIDYTVALQRARVRARAGLLVAIIMSVTAVSAAAQENRIQPEVRSDAIFAAANTYHGGLGASIPLGTYVRVSLVAGGGVTVMDDESVSSGRADVVARFLIDPFRESKWGPYAGAGVSVRGERGSTGRAYLVAMFGLEGPPSASFVPALEIGLGGGTRVGLILRRSLPRRR